jgi:hypothetical protein
VELRQQLSGLPGNGAEARRQTRVAGTPGPRPADRRAGPGVGPEPRAAGTAPAAPCPVGAAG